VTTTFLGGLEGAPESRFYLLGSTILHYQNCQTPDVNITLTLSWCTVYVVLRGIIIVQNLLKLGGNKTCITGIFTTIPE